VSESPGGLDPLATGRWLIAVAIGKAIASPSVSVFPAMQWVAYLPGPGARALGKS
jgi:hypothetical protein